MESLNNQTFKIYQRVNIQVVKEGTIINDTSQVYSQKIMN